MSKHDFLEIPANPQGLVVCIHGLTASSSDFDLVKNALLKEGFAVYVPVLPCHERSFDAKKLTTKILDQFCKKIAHDISQISCAPKIIIGHSIGAFCAQEISKLVTCQQVILIAPPYVSRKFSHRMIALFLSLLPYWITFWFPDHVKTKRAVQFPRGYSSWLVYPVSALKTFFHWQKKSRAFDFSKAHVLYDPNDHLAVYDGEQFPHKTIVEGGEHELLSGPKEQEVCGILLDICRKGVHAT